MHVTAGVGDLIACADRRLAHMQGKEEPAAKKRKSENSSKVRAKAKAARR